MECVITAAGLKLLATLDGPIETVNQDAVRSLTASDRQGLVRLLEQVRAGD